MNRMMTIFLAAVLLVSSCTGIRTLEKEQREGYSCMLVEYKVPGGEKLRSYLLIPDGAGRGDRRPGLVLLHDHGARFDIGKEKLVRPLPSAPMNIQLSSKQWADDNFDGVWFGDKLARDGFVVIVPEALYWGSRSSAACQKWSRVRFLGEDGNLKKLKEEVYEGQRFVYDSLAQNGLVWAEKTLHEDAAAVKVLKKLGCVDNKKIGAFGWSMGAHRCWLLAAFCKDVKTGVALCWMTLKETCADPPTASDYSMMIPSLREKYDFPDIASLLAPRPFLFLAGTQDKLFPAWSVEKAYEKMHELYGDSSCNLDTEFFEGPHHCGLEVQRRIEDYLLEQLPL